MADQNLIHYHGNSKVIKKICELLNKRMGFVRDVTRNGVSVLDDDLVAHIQVPELGTSHENAGYGDYADTAYQHSQMTSGNPHNVTLDDLGIPGIADQMQMVLQAIGAAANLATSGSTEEDPTYIVTHDGDYISMRTVANVLAWH